MEKLRHENTVLHSSALSPSEQNRELQVSYHHLNEAERAWNYTRMLLDIIREEVDIHTHEIVHLEHHMELQDVELEERAETIADLEQQLLELQGQAPLDPIDHEEIDAMSGVDEDYVSSL
jgi:cell division FtsZ-interacting protein ZapD